MARDGNQTVQGMNTVINTFKRVKTTVAFNMISGLAICLAIAIAGVGFFAWDSELPQVSSWHERALQSQGLIAGFVGCFVSVAAWLGIFGVNEDRPRLVTAYVALIGALVIPTAILGILLLHFMSKWAAEADGYLSGHMEKYYQDEQAANFTDALQLGFECCGLTPLPDSYDMGAKLPTSCCDPLQYKTIETDIYCPREYKFRHSCNGVLSKSIRCAISWLASLSLLLSLSFAALLVCLHFYRSSEDSLESAVPQKPQDPKAKERSVDPTKESPQKPGTADASTRAALSPDNVADSARIRGANVGASQKS